MEENLNNIKPLMRVKDFAQFIGLSIATLDRLQAESRLCPADYLLGKAKIRIWKLETIKNWLELHRNPKSTIHKELTT